MIFTYSIKNRITGQVIKLGRDASLDPELAKAFNINADTLKDWEFRSEVEHAGIGG